MRGRLVRAPAAVLAALFIVIAVALACRNALPVSVSTVAVSIEGACSLPW